MIKTFFLFCILFSNALTAKVEPISDGEHYFSHRFAEHPSILSIQLTAIIKWPYIKLANKDDNSVFPFGVIKQGELVWHKPSKQWIIVTSPEDRETQEVGGCTDGPEVIDLKNKVYWTC